VAGEEDGDFALFLVVFEELLDVVLSNDIESDGRFIKKEDFGGMEKCGDEFHFHSFAEGEFSDGSTEEFFHIEQ
jgi:hypothetical protein